MLDTTLIPRSLSVEAWGLIMLLVGFALKEWKASIDTRRERAERREVAELAAKERRDARDERRADTEDLLRQIEVNEQFRQSQAALINRNVEQSAKQMRDIARQHNIKLEENTELTRQGVARADAAYHEANNVNVKLERLSPAPGQREQIDRIEETTAETKDLASEIQANLVKDKVESGLSEE